MRVIVDLTFVPSGEIALFLSHFGVSCAVMAVAVAMTAAARINVLLKVIFVDIN